MSHLRAWIVAAASTAVTAALITPTVPADAAPTASPGVVGAQTAGDSLFPHQGNGGYDVSHYDLDIAWTTPNVITATATITATTTQQPLEQFSLDLEGLSVDAVTVDGAASAHARVDSGDTFKLVVTPASPVSGEFTTTVTYSGTPVSHTDPDGSDEGWVATAAQEGAVALNEPVGAMTWFPNNNTPQDKATFTTRLTVPYAAGLGALNRVAVSNGVLVGSPTVSGSTRTYTWNQPNPQASYLAMVGIGRYTASESDVALTSGTTHEWSFADPSATGSGRFATARGRLSSILKGIEKHYGPYPGSSTGLVLDVSSLGYALETQDRPYFENSIDGATLIHELAHQWFGDAVSPADWSDVWLNEGPATFIETQVGADLGGGTSTHDTYYGDWKSSSASFWATPAAGFTDASDLFGSQVYARGAIALEALRTALGNAVFTDVMRTWLETYGGGSATTAQFIDVAEQVSGYDLAAFFQTWIYGTTKPTAWPTAYQPGTLNPTPTPSMDSLVRVGRRVTVVTSAWDPGATLTYRWFLDGKAVPNAYRSSYVATAFSLGKSLTVAVTGRRTGYPSVTRTSSPRTVLRGFQVPMADPTVRGNPRVGATLRAYPGSHSNTTLRQQWYVDDRAVARATTTKFTLRPQDRSRVVRFAARWTRPGYFPVVKYSSRLRVR
ncbi:M1 family aminopeptidase [Nocardioides plantarum]|uniref:Aminopeptidase N n=1 Tax=Nocardioides plantarum TaxID=29299 RepID=A0ABV5K6I0_9ACTN|nr:M1 family aminopeptidase [Nocardioides plantarum]